jgi:hypothetical protein
LNFILLQRMRIIFSIVFFSFFFNQVSSQNTISALRITEKITVDGKLDEKSWSQAQIVSTFTQVKPNPGKKSSQETSVKVMYDDDALYVGAICYDNPNEVSKILSLRDDFNANIDNFQIIIDTYNDDQNGFIFGVSSMGVQYDAKIYIGDESPELDMAWHSAVEFTEEGWQVEIRIPYSAFRFPKKEEQDWGINFFRYISRFREESTWKPYKTRFWKLGRTMWRFKRCKWN